MVPFFRADGPHVGAPEMLCNSTSGFDRFERSDIKERTDGQVGVGPGRTHSINTRTAVEARQRLESYRSTPESTFLHYMPFFFLINLRIIVSVMYVCASEKI